MCQTACAAHGTAHLLESPTSSGRVRVRYHGWTAGWKVPEEEEVIPTRLRPPPPEVAPAEWEPLALVDSPLELSYLYGWWDVVVEQVKLASYDERFVVVAAEYDAHHAVSASKLRPRWSYDPASRHEPSGGWSFSAGGTIYALDEWRAERREQRPPAQPSRNSGSDGARFWYRQPVPLGPRLCGTPGCSLPDRHSGPCPPAIYPEGSRTRKPPERLEAGPASRAWVGA